MAHNIEVAANGDAAFFAARQSAWHRLGTTTTEAQTAEQALELAHLSGWDVRKAPLTALATGTDGEALHLPVGNKYATLRNNPFTGKPEPLGVVGKVYQPIQNEENTELLNTLIDQRGALDRAVSTFSIRHTKSAKSNIEAARQALTLTLKYQDEFQLATERMIQETMTDTHFQQYLDHLFTAPTNFDRHPIRGEQKM